MINDLKTKDFRFLLAYPNGADEHLREPSMAAWELRELLNGQAPRYHPNIQLQGRN
ncbi:unnamed protein product [Arabis nemorensis]|uniref:Uncharacterized protein n=1 Tax=Arabis nemorensis TaxID=586526 RepID=A0A565B1L3_9BRAS|nr:unnamed protein product [Arabis nemorensis]